MKKLIILLLAFSLAFALGAVSLAQDDEMTGMSFEFTDEQIAASPYL